MRTFSPEELSSLVVKALTFQPAPDGESGEELVVFSPRTGAKLSTIICSTRVRRALVESISELLNVAAEELSEGDSK